MSEYTKAGRRLCLCVVGLVAATLLAPVSVAQERPAGKKKIAKLVRYRVPYQLTETKHVLVRVKINGKGPYNFIIDTGAPALFIGTATAKKAGIEPDEFGWGTVDSFEIEGGPVLKKAKGRIDDPFQLTGMNRMNIAGHQLDGILGYTALAYFRIQYDFTRPHLVWTRLDWEPPWPRGMARAPRQQPKEVAALGGLVNFATALVGRRPDPEIMTRGFLGVELVDDMGAVHVWRVLRGSPAAKAGVEKGDRILRLQEKSFKDLGELQEVAAKHAAGQTVDLEIERSGEKRTITIKTSEAL